MPTGKWRLTSFSAAMVLVGVPHALRNLKPILLVDGKMFDQPQGHSS